MKKSLPVILVFVFVLAACNLPIKQSTPDPAKVATLVAATLTAAQPITPLESTLTLPPQEEPTPTATTTIEPTPTETATPTLSPEDPALTLGEPSFKDTFSSGVSFGLSPDPYEDPAIKINVQNGAMVFTSYQANAGRRWRLTSRNPRDLYLEGTFTSVTCTGTDEYGLVLRSQTYSDGTGYYFGLTCNGKYTFVRWDTSDATILIKRTDSAEIQVGPGKSNRIGVMARGNSFRLFINGVYIEEVKDSGIDQNGYIGAYSNAWENPGMLVRLEEISLWTLQ